MCILVFDNTNTRNFQIITENNKKQISVRQINIKYNNDLCKTCKLISSLKYIRIMMIHAINSKTQTRGNYENKNYM